MIQELVATMRCYVKLLGDTVITWNDSLQLCAKPESTQRFFIRGYNVFGPSGILQPGVFRTYTGIVETSADGVRLNDLTFFRLQDVSADAVKDARGSLCKSGAVVFSIKA